MSEALHYLFIGIIYYLCNEVFYFQEFLCFFHEGDWSESIRCFSSQIAVEIVSFNICYWSCHWTPTYLFKNFLPDDTSILYFTKRTPTLYKCRINTHCNQTLDNRYGLYCQTEDLKLKVEDPLKLRLLIFSPCQLFL